jgi:ubiquinone/menaquinone biosynthesis C-methylase UbiE
MSDEQKDCRPCARVEPISGDRARECAVARVLDPEGAHLAALRRLVDFHGQRVLEMGCGEGRLTAGIAADASHVLAFDPDSASVAVAGRNLAAELRERVEFRAAAAESIEIARGSFDLVVFSWSL